MKSKYNYNQKEKEYVRKNSLSHAIKSLTEKRSISTCVNRNYVRDIYNWYNKQDYEPKSQKLASIINTEYIDLWEGFHDSNVGVKKANELVVCYLSGPNPMNDFNILIESGIHPNNIWAFEIDKGTYKNALENIDKSEFPMLKIHKGSIEQFFVHVPKKFDIVYLDFCGAIPSNQKLTRVMVSMLKNQRLNSPGALITNVASPDLSDSKQKKMYTNIIAEYLIDKNYLEDSKEGIVQNKYEDISEIKGDIKKSFDEFYGQFITRHIFDLASIIAPWSRFADSIFWSRIISKKPNEIGKTNDIEFQLPITKALNNSYCFEEEYNKFKDNWINQMNGLPNSNIGIKDVLISFELLKYDSNLYTIDFAKIIEEYTYEDKMYQFCDKPNKNITIDYIVNQYAYPMHYVTKCCKRYSYQAKSTKMYTDVTIFDDCRYIYEWLPTIDLLNTAYDDISQQLIYRFALDGLVKNRMWYNSEYFYSGSVVNIHDSGEFKDIILKERIEVNEEILGGEVNE